LNQRDELFAYLSEREGCGRHSEYTIVRRGHDDAPPPLSFSQERFWFLDQFEHARPVYNGCKVVRLTGELRVEVLAECLELIVRRHEVLRTTYPALDGQPMQRVAAPCPIEVSVTQLDASESDQPLAIERLVRHEWLQPIDLAKELPIRARLARIDPTEHLLILTLHQIVVDSQSVAIFFAELWTAYEAKLSGKEPQLAALPVQYADFARWQRHRVSDQTFQSHRQYWLERLSGILPVLNLPTDKPRPPVQGFDGSRLSILLPETVQLKLKELSRENGVTLFMTLLAAFKTLLYRYTGEKDLLVGCPVVNRQLPETENLLGSFINTLVLRTDYGGSPSFLRTLQRIRETCVGAFAHQDFPFEKLVEELQPERDLARNPLFQVMFAFQNIPVPALELPDIRSETVEIDGGMTKFDLTFSLIDKENGIGGHIEYNTDLFDCGTIERMARHFQVLLETIAADPDQSIATLPIMSDAERRKIVVEWNDTGADYPKHKCIHELFEEQVERTPHAIAVEFEGQRMKYHELNARANRLGNHLISLGVGRESLVGICVERSVEMVVGLMGILKAGGAYLPLDPSYPTERLRFMLEDSQAAVLLTQEKLIDDRGWRREDGDARFKVVCLDRDWTLIEQKKDSNPRSGIGSDHLAYVIYTSGSTGQPKGVQVSHRSVTNCLIAIGERAGLTNPDRLLAVTTISFDIATLELFLPLLVGGTVIVASPEEAMDGAELLRRLKESSATAMQATPSTWRMLLDARWRGARDFKIFCGGETLSRELAGRLLDCGTLWNLYGPTESTIWSTVHKVKSGEGPVPIGRPIVNTQIYILDSHRQPVPIGIPGDVYIGGDGLARGYLNRPELTAEKFISNPLSGNSKSRLYQTGDRSKYLADGSIEFLGRIDDQVKIRGHRIELGEVEFVLNQHPAVRACVVVARARDSLLEQSLVGYVVPKQQPAPSVAELRSYLKEKLPEYMIPSVFMPLDDLPLTPNGKVDRNALPPPDGERPLLDQRFIEPRSEIEELIAQVWREILKLDKIGIHDNFFELGGHSLLATRVVARLRISFSIDIALRKLFELPTVAGLAQHIEHLRHSQFGTTIAPIVPVDRTQPLPLSFSQRRLWYLQKVDVNLSAYNIPAAFRIKGDLDIAALEQALNEMIARHEVLRSSIKEAHGEPRQEILPTLRITLPVIDLSHLPDERAETETRRLYDADARQLHELANAPLLRATLVKLAVDNHVFILNFHHIIADGSSLAIFYKELTVLYEALRSNKTVSLPRLPVQHADYAAWQHEWLKSSSYDTQLDYWKRQLARLPEPCVLPKDFDCPVPATYRGARLSMQLSEELTESLKSLSRQLSVTTFMTLFATFNVLMSRISGLEDIVMGSTIAGRNHPETDGLIGFFINALPLRCDLAGNPNFVTLLHRVRETCLDAFTNQDVPFEKIVEDIKPLREPGRNPIFDILFNMADISERILTLAGCEVTKLARVDPGAKFDIVLHAPETGGKIELAIVYNTALFRERRITLLLEQWGVLLDQVASHAELPISQLSLMTDASRSVLPDPKEGLDDRWQGAIHELLAEQARRSPESLAVIDGNQSWTYEDIDRYANRLAHSLIDSGIRPKDLIAIYAHRSSSLVVSLFGILKAGASFLILDPAYPAARTIDYLRIAQPKGWLQLEGGGEPPRELLSCLDSLTMRCRMNVPQSKAEILRSLAACANTNPATIVTANDPAYVAFTSGSTGEPKGVLCRHGPITHFLPWQKDAFQLSEADRFAMLSGLAYNHLQRDVFTAVSVGATLYIPNQSEARSPEYLVHWLQRNAVTVLHLTPALGQLLLTSGGEARLPAVHRVFFGGDVLTPEMVASIRRLAPNATVGSFYGATETQRAVGYFEIANNPAAAQVEALKAVPLGRGIKDIQLLVLNRASQLAGIGELGELYVRSPHLAKGYIGDEALTVARFVTNPFTNHPNDRLYRTGELARYLFDGNVEWFGRNDRRVNIRGFRVELEEIEIALKQHLAVKNTAVVLQNYEIPTPENSKLETRNPKLDQRLVAYVAAEEDGESFVDLLRSFLSERLPEYMVPSHFVILDCLPLSPNGKVDYQALPPVRFTGVTGESSDAPQSEVERTLSRIFAQVLGREKVDVNEDFFRLGGHSLLAAQAAARIREAFGVALELRAFLGVPTVAGLARRVESLLSPRQIPSRWAKDEREEFEI
jgi:amino acid adenylation domain-containing protein